MVHTLESLYYARDNWLEETRAKRTHTIQACWMRERDCIYFTRASMRGCVVCCGAVFPPWYFGQPLKITSSTTHFSCLCKKKKKTKISLSSTKKENILQLTISLILFRHVRKSCFFYFVSKSSSPATEEKRNWVIIFRDKL